MISMYLPVILQQCMLYILRALHLLIMRHVQCSFEWRRSWYCKDLSLYCELRFFLWDVSRGSNLIPLGLITLLVLFTARALSCRLSDITERIVLLNVSHKVFLLTQRTRFHSVSDFHTADAQHCRRGKVYVDVLSVFGWCSIETLWVIMPNLIVKLNYCFFIGRKIRFIALMFFQSMNF